MRAEQDLKPGDLARAELIYEFERRRQYEAALLAEITNPQRNP